MEKDEKQDLKTLAETALVKSSEEISDDGEIIQLLKDKVIIIKETNKIEVKYSDMRPLIRIPLFLAGKFIGFKVLNVFESPDATIEELSSNLNLPIKALSRPLGILTNELIEKTPADAYKIRAFKILEFLKNLEGPKNTATQKPGHKKSASKPAAESLDVTFALKKEGIKNLAGFLEIDETALRKVIFFRENEPTLIDLSIVTGETVAEKQLNSTLVYLLAYKYCYGVESLPASVLRNRLNKLALPTLVNLSTSLHKFSEFVLHEAKLIGSTKNYYAITPAGEEDIKHKIRLGLGKPKA